MWMKMEKLKRQSPSARRAWVEIGKVHSKLGGCLLVALREEGVG